MRHSRPAAVIAAEEVTGSVQIAITAMEATMATKITVVFEDDLEGGRRMRRCGSPSTAPTT
jgi:hypothetical protein